MVLQYYADFLREHPTATLVVQVVHATGDKDRIYDRAGDALKKWAAAINPSTGKSYIYKEPLSKNSWVINNMPKLRDVRGQMVIASGYAKRLGFGMEAPVGEKWTRLSHCANVRMAFENHYEVDNVDKLDYIKAFYEGGDVDGEAMSAQRGVVQRSLMSDMEALTEALPFAYISTNRVKRLGWGNEGIAEYINPRVFTNSNALMNTRGFLYGWVSADYVTAAVTKAVWLNNYPEGGLEYATVSFDPPQGSSLPSKRYSVQAGTTIRVPANIFPSATPQGRAFIGWECNGTQYLPNTQLVAKGDMRLTPRYSMTWAHLQRAISNAPKGTKTYIDLPNDIKAYKTDSALEIPKGVEIELKLNGHTIDRAASDYSKNGSVFHVHGKLTLKGMGTVKGGRAYSGGGIYVGMTGYVELGDVRVTGNTAMISGAGIYAEPKEYTTPEVAIKVNAGARVEGNTLDNLGTFATNGDPSNVRLGKNCLIEGVEHMAAGTNACVLGISTMEQPTKWKAVSVSTPNLDERYIDNVMQHLSNESKGFSLVIDPTNRQVVMASPHTVTFRYGVGSQEERQVVQPFQKATKPETPTRTGYVFDDWYPTKDQPGSATPYDFNTPVTKDAVLEAHWNRRRLTVSFDSDGGSEVRSEEVEYGNKVTRPADPTREGYDFSGWSYKMQNYAPWDLGRRGIAYDFDKPVLRNVDLKANWAPKQCTVTFTDGTVVKGTQRVAYGQKATPLNPEPTRLNYVFDGWHLPARVQGCQERQGRQRVHQRKRNTDHDQ